jgi:hypothetical protein
MYRLLHISNVILIPHVGSGGYIQDDTFVFAINDSIHNRHSTINFTFFRDDSTKLGTISKSNHLDESFVHTDTTNTTDSYTFNFHTISTAHN